MGLRKGERAPGTATVTRFRAKLRKYLGDDYVQQRVLALAVAEGVLADAELQAVDSTNTDCRGAVIDTFNLVAAAIRQVIRKVARCLERAPEALAEEWKLERYMARSIKGTVAIDWSNEAARNGLITEEIRDADKLAEQVSALKLTLPDEVTEAIAVLAKVARQDVDELPDGSFAVARRTARGRVISLTDPEARHGRKSSSKAINGFKTHVMGTIESQFVTGIVVTDAATHDSEPTTALLEQAADHGLKPHEALGDGAYGTGPNVRAAAAHGVDLLTKYVVPTANRGAISKRKFDIDLDAMQVRCPAGQATETFTWIKAGDERVRCFRFAKETCLSCPLRSECSSDTAKGTRGRVVILATHEEELQRLKVFNESERGPALLRKRSAVERLISHLVRLGMRHARFFGMQKVQFQAFMTAAAYNLQRLFTLTAQRARTD